MSLTRLYSAREVSIRAFKNEWTPNLRHARRANLLQPSLSVVRRYATADESRPSTSAASKTLPSEEESSRSSFIKGLASRMDNMQAVVFNAGQRLNELTGYSGIEALKIAIEEQEKQVVVSRQAVQKANEDYKNAIAQRSSSQKEVNELLQRKHMWSPNDLERFTTLYRSDHANEQAENQAHARLEEAEREADDARALLSRNILTRYHEEQIWSDKIRRASTWGTWGLMGFNIFLFVVVQLALEPWKRRRLVGNFEEKVRSVYKEENTKREQIIPTLIAKPAEQEKSDALEGIIPVVMADAVTQTLPEAVLSVKVVPEVTPEVTPEVIPQVSPDIVPDVLSEVVPEAAFETVSEAVSEATPEALPKVLTEETIVENGLNPITEADPQIPALQDPTEPQAVETQVLLDTITPVAKSPSFSESFQTSSASVQAVVNDYTRRAKNLFSNEIVNVRQVDVTTLALESAACGAVVMAGILSLIYRR